MNRRAHRRQPIKSRVFHDSEYSFIAVKSNLVLMVLWGAFIAICTFAAMVPAFLGLYLVLPLFGHASWHLYRASEARA